MLACLLLVACSTEAGPTTTNAQPSSSSAAPLPEDEPEDDNTASPTPAATATTTCVLLRSFVNDSADIANDAAAEVSASVDPVERRDAVLAGFDELLTRAERHRDDVRALEPTDFVQGTELVDDLLEGAEQALTELADERATFALLPSLERADTAGRVGQFFNSLEKAMSVVEPAVVEWAGPGLIEAFADEPECRFVVQA